MGLYDTKCRDCGAAFRWFSGEPEQRCMNCRLIGKSRSFDGFEVRQYEERIYQLERERDEARAEVEWLKQQPVTHVHGAARIAELEAVLRDWVAAYGNVTRFTHEDEDITQTPEHRCWERARALLAERGK